MVKELRMIVHNVRSTYNVGSLLRTAECFGLHLIYLTGYTPYPELPNDNRLPHIKKKLTSQISKTALGAEKLLSIEYWHDPLELIGKLKLEGVSVFALEQAENSINLTSYKAPEKITLIVGNELTGLTNDVLNKADGVLEIPMRGRKESLNVSVAAAIGLYHILYL